MAVRMGPEFTPSMIENQLSSHGMVASLNWIGSGTGVSFLAGLSSRGKERQWVGLPFRPGAAYPPWLPRSCMDLGSHSLY